MYKERIENYVEEHRQQIIDLTSRLVRIPSTKADSLPNKPFGEGPDAALEEALKIGKELGFAVTNYDGYVGTIDFAQGSPPQLDILAHLDIVPAPPDDWTVTQPFEPLEKDGRLYGRGASDDKGPSVAALIAMKAVKDLEIPLTKNVRVILGTDEESGSSDIEYYYAKEKVAPMTFSPDATFPVINVEKGRFNGTISASYPSSGELPRLVSISCGVRANVVPDRANVVLEGFDTKQLAEIADKWSKDTEVNYKITEDSGKILLEIRGLGGHAAEPELSRNAVTATLDLMARLPFAKSEGVEKLNYLAKLFPYGDWHGKAVGIKMSDALSGNLTISLNTLNVTETDFTALFDSRTSLNSNKENTVDVFLKNMEAGGLGVEYKTNAGHYVPEDSPFIQTLLKVYEQYSGNKGECLSTGGTTYVHGIENGVAFGATLPETSGNVHGANEYMVIDELLLSTKIFAQVIIDLCS